eukprot:tig00021043_g17619.t1
MESTSGAPQESAAPAPVEPAETAPPCQPRFTTPWPAPRPVASTSSGGFEPPSGGSEPPTADSAALSAAEPAAQEPAPSGPDPFDSLPEDLLCRILHAIGPLACVNTRVHHVSRRWREAFRSTHWELLDFTPQGLADARVPGSGLKAIRRINRLGPSGFHLGAVQKIKFYIRNKADALTSLALARALPEGGAMRYAEIAFGTLPAGRTRPRVKAAELMTALLRLDLESLEVACEPPGRPLLNWFESDAAVSSALGGLGRPARLRILDAPRLPLPEARIAELRAAAPRLVRLTAVLLHVPSGLPALAAAPLEELRIRYPCDDSDDEGEQAPVESLRPLSGGPLAASLRRLRFDGSELNPPAYPDLSSALFPRLELPTLRDVRLRLATRDWCYTPVPSGGIEALASGRAAECVKGLRLHLTRAHTLEALGKLTALEELELSVEPEDEEDVTLGRYECPFCQGRHRTENSAVLHLVQHARARPLARPPRPALVLRLT